MPRERGLEFVGGDLSLGGGNGPDMTLEWLTASDGSSDTPGGSSTSHHQLLMPPAAISTAAGYGVGAGGRLPGVASAGRTNRLSRPTSGKGDGRSSKIATQRGTSASLLSPLIPSPSSAALASAMASTIMSPAGSCGTRKWGDAGTGMKQGKFSKAETQTIVDAVKVYARNNCVSVERLCEEGGHKGDLKGAWIAIAECLPDRTIQSIYRHGIRQLHGLKRGPWSPQEVCTLQTLVSQHGNKWRTIEKSMGRSADTCRDKYREIIHLPGKGPWEDAEEKMLVKAVTDRMQGQGGLELNLKGDEKVDVQWADVSRMVGTRNRTACQKKWEYLQGQRLEERLQSQARSKVRLNLSFVRAIIKTKARDESEVVWTRLPFPRAQLRWKTLREKTPATANMSLQEALSTVMKKLQGQVVREDSLEPTPLPLQDTLGEASTTTTTTTAAGSERQGPRSGDKRSRAGAGGGGDSATSAAVQPDADGLDDLSGGAASASLGAGERCATSEKKKSKKKKKNKKRGREQMEGVFSARGSTRTDEEEQPLVGESPEATVADWDSLNLNCDQPISADDHHLDLDHLSETLLRPAVGLAPIVAKSDETPGRSAERRNRKLMRAVALALDED